jgi:alkylresorcinol/alkylpyrone synthase
MLGSMLPPAAVERYGRMVVESRIRRRSAVAPLARLAQLGGVAERNALYTRLAVPLAERVARAALERAALAPGAVDALLVASSTGHVVPTLEQHVAARLGLAPGACRLSLTGLGCAGAVRALGCTADLLRQPAPGVALVVAVELCSLWLPVGELSPQDARTSVLMGDGAGAVVVASGGPQGAPQAAGPQILASQSVLWPDSLDARGATLTSAGLRHFSSPRIARVVARHLRRTVDEFLAMQGLARAALGFCAVNPSELGLATAIADHLELPGQPTAIATAVWEQHGNTLAAGPLHVLRTLSQSAAPADGALGLLVTLGPGITCDLLLLRWHGALPVVHRDEDSAALA